MGRGRGAEDGGKCGEGRAERTRHHVFTDEHDGGGPGGDEEDWYQQLRQDAPVESAGFLSVRSPCLCHAVVTVARCQCVTVARCHGVRCGNVGLWQCNLGTNEGFDTA